MQATKEYEDLVLARKHLKTALQRVKNPIAFGQAFQMARTALLGTDLASLLSVSQSSVARWSNSISAPAAIGRKSILRHLLAMVEERRLELELKEDQDAGLSRPNVR